MVHLRSSLVALLAIAAPSYSLSAQNPQSPRPAPAAADHTVVRGETLWGLAERYLQTPYAWPSIHDLNRALVADPNLIFPGQTLRIPGLVATAEVRMEVAVLPAEGQPMAPAVQPRPGIFTSGSTTGSGGGAFAAMRPQEGERAGTMVRRQEAPRPAVPRDIFLRAGWIDPLDEASTPAHEGRVSGFEGVAARTSVRTTASLYSEVRVTVTGERTPAPGTVLLTFRPGGMVAGEGRIAHPTGLLVVRRVDGAGVVAQVERLFDRVMLDDLVVVAPSHPARVGVHPRPVSDGMEATILAFARPHELQMQGDIAFLDVGAAAGVSVGDEFVAVAAREAGWSGTEAGRLQVVAVRDRTAAVRILKQDGAIFSSGVPVRLAGKMP